MSCLYYGNRAKETDVGGGFLFLFFGRKRGAGGAGGRAAGWLPRVQSHGWSHAQATGKPRPLAGERRQIHLDKPGYRWHSNNGTIPVNRPFSWYKTTFQAPSGDETVVVDLLGLNKGMAWVNGNSLGRYWPSYVAAEMGGCHHCDYRGEFKSEGDGQKCLTSCNEPSQRFYHVPRSFLKPGEPNTVILFEEAGGDPSRVGFHTIAVGHVCVETAEKGDDVTLSCQHGKTISSVDVASFGVVRGQCGAYEGGCESKTAYQAFTAACIGKESCTVRYTDEFTGAGCESGVLTVQATC